MFISSPQVIELEDAVPPSELHLDQALEEQERLDRFNIVLFFKPPSIINTNTCISTPTSPYLEHHHQLYSNWFSQRNDEEDGEQELVSRGHVFCHLPPRVHSYRVRFYKDFNRVTEKNLTSMFPLPWFLFCVKPYVVTT